MRRRNHVNPLGPYFAEFRGCAPSLDPALETEVEIGCADAQFLFERAAANDQRNYVGLEIRESLVHEVNQRATSEDLPVQGVFCNANAHLCQLFGSHSVERVFINFPDPWFKRRHRKRRMVDSELAESIHVILVPGGEVFMQTDIWENALEMMEIFERLERQFYNVRGPWSFFRGPHPYRAQSWREHHCASEGLPIWRILYRARAPFERGLAQG